MLKFVIVIVFCVWSIKVSCSPIIKASGVQWSEPKGTGKGNITLIIIPQNSSCSNDTDMLVAVKSDYQILSQDLQLLNLVVNQTQNDTTRETKCGESLSSLIQSHKPDASDWELNKINLTHNANYFESLGKSGNTQVNSDQSLAGKKNAPEAMMSPKGSNSIDVFNMLNSIANNSYDIKRTDVSNDTNINLPVKTTKNNYNPVHLNSNDPKNSVGSSMNALNSQKEITNSNDPSPDSNNSFLQEAIDIFDKLKQNQSYSKTVNSNEDQLLRSGNTESKTYDKLKDVQSGDLKLADEDILKEFLPHKVGRNDKSYIDGNNGAVSSPTTCLPFFIAPNNSQEATLVSSDVTGILNLLTSSQTVNVEDNHLTTIINVDETTTPLSKATLDTVTPIANDISSNPQGAKENQASNLMVMLGTQPTTDNCTTAATHHEPDTATTMSIGVFDEISVMVSSQSSKILREAQSYVTTSNLDAGISDSTPNSEQRADCSNTVNSLNSGQGPMPKKITLEPKINCEDSFVKTETLQSHSGNKGRELIGQHGNSAVVESSVLTNDDEVKRKKEIPYTLNASSFDDFKLAEFIANAGHESNYVQPEDSYETPIVIRINNKALKLNDQHPYVLEKNKGNDNEVPRKYPAHKAFFAGSSIGKALKMRLKSKNAILDQNPSYRSDTSNNKQECDVTLKVLTDSADYDSTESKTVLQGKTTNTSKSIVTKNTLQDSNSNQMNEISFQSSLGTPALSVKVVTPAKPTEETDRSKESLESETSGTTSVKNRDGTHTTNCKEDNEESSQTSRIPSTALRKLSTNDYITSEFPLFNTNTCTSDPKYNELFTNTDGLNKMPSTETPPRNTTYTSKENGIETTTHYNDLKFSASLSINASTRNGIETTTHITSMHSLKDITSIGTTSLGEVETKIPSSAIKYQYLTKNTLKPHNTSTSSFSELGKSNKNDIESIPKSIRIPSSSIKEIVIQIKKNNKPVKGKMNVTHKCLEKTGKLRAFNGQENPSYLESGISLQTPDRQIIFNNGKEKIFKYDTFSVINNPDRRSKLINLDERGSEENNNQEYREKEFSSNDDIGPNEDKSVKAFDGMQNLLIENDCHDNDVADLQKVVTEDNSNLNNIIENKSKLAKYSVANLLRIVNPDSD